jgi:hypothetical protein
MAEVCLGLTERLFVFFPSISSIPSAARFQAHLMSLRDGTEVHPNKRPTDCLDEAEQRPQLELHGDVYAEKTAPSRAVTFAFVLARTDSVCNGLGTPTQVWPMSL